MNPVERRGQGNRHGIQREKHAPAAIRPHLDRKIRVQSIAHIFTIEVGEQANRNHKPKPRFGLRSPKMKEREGNLLQPSLVHGGRREAERGGEKKERPERKGD